MTNDQRKILRLIRDNPVQLARWFGFTLLTPEAHNPWIRSLLLGDGDWTLQAHRGSYKTTCVSVAFPLHMMIKPEKNIIFMRKTDADIYEIIKQVKKVIESDAFRYISAVLYGRPAEVVKATQSEISTSLFDSVRGTSQLLGLGIKGSLTGKHADWVHTDDIVNLRDRISRAEREYTKQVYQELQNIRNRGGRITNTGTPWHRDDAFGLMGEINRLDCYSSNIISPDQLAQLRASMSPSLFAANYELKHIATENALFPEAPMFFSDPELLRNGQAHIDAAYGGEDSSALTLLTPKQPDGKYYGLGKLRQTHIDNCLDEYLRIAEMHACGPLSCETNADKGYLKKEINGRGYPCYGYHEKMNKYVKIATFLRREWTSIVWHESTDPEYIEQILDYTEDATHDDAPDSAASQIRRLDSTRPGARGF